MNQPTLIIGGHALKKTLSFLSGGITLKPIVPVMENVKLVLTHASVSLTTTDLQQTLSVSLACDTAYMGEGEVQALLPFALLNSLVNRLPDQPLTFRFDLDSFGHTLVTANGSYKLPGENPIDFPKPTTDNGKAVVLDLTTGQRALLTTALRNTVFCVSGDELHPAMTGACMHVHENTLTLAATNGHALSRQRIDLPDTESNQNLSVILPPKFAQNLIKLSLGDDVQGISLSLTTMTIMAQIGQSTIQARLIDERFPDFENAIPTSNDKVARIPKVDLMGSLNRIILIANQTTFQVRLAFTENKLTVSAEDMDMGRHGSETILCQYDNEDTEIGFSAKYLLSLLSHVSGDDVRMEMSQPNRAAILYGEDENALMLLMPLMLKVYA